MPPHEITEAVESLDDLEGVTVLDEPYLYDNSKWVINVRLRPDGVETDSLVPSETEWFVHLPETYPAGSIGIYPADQAENTLTATFAHQRLNVPGDDDTPWRKGDICVARYGHTLNQTGATGEPTEAGERLRWHLQRALVWLGKASRGDLREPGEPFEVPEFDTSTAPDRTLAFNETRSSFETWSSKYGEWGSVVLNQLPTSEETFATQEFRTADEECVYQPEWGDYVDETAGDKILGTWALVEEPPLQPPWEAPETWQDLDNLLDETTFDAFELRAKIKPILNEEDPMILLIGFPIPETIGGEPVLVRWQPIEILEFEDPSDVGHRPTPTGQRRAERITKGRKQIRWLDADNWAHEQLARRGHLDKWLLNRNVLLIGAGALGSTVAECLVRAGCQQITIIDDESCEIGNLARHTLSLDDVGRNKASAVASRLQRLSPNVRAVDVDTAFPPSGEMPDVIDEAEVVIDCTASRAVRQALDDERWDHPVVFCSAAMGRRANRLFCFTAYTHSFPYSSYDESFEPWRLQEQIEWDDDEDAVPERVGCWHPASVIRMDRVMTWAGIVIRLLDQKSDLSLGETEFTVLETTSSSDLPLIAEATPPFQDAVVWEAPGSEATVEVPIATRRAMHERCTQDHPDETGGILAGTDRGDMTALVTNATDPPRDSIQERTRFLRGTEEVDEWLKEARDRFGIGYLGEWHYHSEGAPEISELDRQAMREIASDDDYDCPHPILFIIGQDETGQFIANCYLFHRDGEYETLRRADTTDSTIADGEGGRKE